MSPEKRLEYLRTASNYTRLDVIGPWQEVIYKEGIAGGICWFTFFSLSLSLRIEAGWAEPMG